MKVKRSNNWILRSAVAIGLLSLAAHCPLGAQNITVSTNLLDWANFGSMNASASISVARRLSLGLNAEYNPWTFPAGESIVYNRHRTFGVTADIWPWYVNAGWSLKMGLQQKQYAMGGLPMFKHDYGERFGRIPLTEEGNAWGAGMAVKYSRILSRNWNLEFSAGAWAGKKWYTRYRCPNCGRRLEQGSAWFLAPYDVSVSIVYVIPLNESSAGDREVRVPYRIKD